MSEGRLQRHLAAILAADVVGFSRMMDADEPGTLARLKALRREIVDALTRQFGGRVFKDTGDGALAEFPSATDAVQCAIEIQQVLAKRNDSAPEGGRILLRIGISLGDVIADGSDVYGNGVNIAARMEGLAEPGAICVSGNVYEHVRNSIDVGFDDLGEQFVKNIDRPVRCFRLGLDPRPAPPPSGAPPAMPDKPSIAVLPFQNMSGDADQEYFADGITEDIITALSHIRWLFVIARNSSFVYKGRAVDVKRVARELGVRYLLEGSVRKLGNRVRITAQLVDAPTGVHHWAERYDRDLIDIFALQDEITRNVAGAIEPRLLAAEGVRSQGRPGADLDAWDMVARAMARFWRTTGHDIEAAIAMLKDAVARHPNYGPAHSMLAFCLVLTGHFGWLPIFEVPKLALDSARRAVELDDNDPWAYLALGYVAFVERRTDDAAAQFRRAVELNPNFAAAHGYWGYALAFDGRSDEAIERMALAMRMSPHDRQNSIFMGGTAVAHYLAHRYDQAIEWARKAVQQGPSMTAPHRILCASLAQSGRLDEAHAVLERMREMQPYISIEWVTRMVPYTPERLTHFLEGLKKAGLT
ncbi:MAG TPA: tetratricopeptide repeat protein [Alphaproteobacteria bacterium]|jgi:adenylate cyclase